MPAAPGCRHSLPIDTIERVDTMDAMILHDSDAVKKDLGGGTSREVLAHNESLMIVRVSFRKGSVGTLHTHPHCQSTYVLSGRFRFTVGGRETEVGPGDTIAFPSGMPHGTLCLEDGQLLDIFNPRRDDFL